MDAKVLSIVGIKKHYGESAVESLLIYAIRDLLVDLNIGKSMNSQQIIRAAQFIIQEYYMLNVYDIRVCFDGIRLGKYGQLFDVIDLPKLCGFLNEYLEQRIALAEGQSYSNHYFAKQEETAAMSQENMERMKKALPKSFEQLGTDPKEVEDKERKEREYQKFKAEYAAKQIREQQEKE